MIGDPARRSAREPAQERRAVSPCLPPWGKVSFGTNDGRGVRDCMKAYAPHQALRASFPRWGKPRQKCDFACASIFRASLILHSTFYILHFTFIKKSNASRFGGAENCPPVILRSEATKDLRKGQHPQFYILHSTFYIYKTSQTPPASAGRRYKFKKDKKERRHHYGNIGKVEGDPQRVQG